MRNTRDVLYAYVFATIIGGVMLGASLLGGHHGGMDHDASGAAGDTHGGDNTSESIALRIFSMRVWTYLLAFGGITGLMLRTIAHTHEPMTAILSLAVGAIAATTAQTLLRRAMASGDSGTVSGRDLVGKTGDVIVPFERGQTGKIRVNVKGENLDVLARTEDERPIGANDEVLVVEMREGNALVTRSPVKTRDP